MCLKEIALEQQPQTTLSKIQEFREQLQHHKQHLKNIRENSISIVGDHVDISFNETLLQELESALNSFEEDLLGDWHWGSEVEDISS